MTGAVIASEAKQSRFSAAVSTAQVGCSACCVRDRSKMENGDGSRIKFAIVFVKRIDFENVPEMGPETSRFRLTHSVEKTTIVVKKDYNDTLVAIPLEIKNALIHPADLL
jgi:hypothetical protein